MKGDLYSFVLDIPFHRAKVLIPSVGRCGREGPVRPNAEQRTGMQIPEGLVVVVVVRMGLETWFQYFKRESTTGDGFFI